MLLVISVPCALTTTVDGLRILVKPPTRLTVGGTLPFSDAGFATPRTPLALLLATNSIGTFGGAGGAGGAGGTGGAGGGGAGAGGAGVGGGAGGGVVFEVSACSLRPSSPPSTQPVESSPHPNTVESNATLNKFLN